MLMIFMQDVYRNAHQSLYNVVVKTDLHEN